MHDDLREHIKHLEEKLLSPEVRTSGKELRKLLDADFFEFGSSGRVLYKGEDLVNGGIGVVNMKLSDFDIHHLAETVVLATYKIFNEDSQQHSLRSSIWKKKDNHWKMVFHQGTKTEKGEQT